MEKESSKLGIFAIVFSILGGFVGLILSIIGLVKYKEPRNRNLTKISLIIGIVWVVFFVIVALTGDLSSIIPQPLF